MTYRVEDIDAVRRWRPHKFESALLWLSLEGATGYELVSFLDCSMFVYRLPGERSVRRKRRGEAAADIVGALVLFDYAWIRLTGQPASLATEKLQCEVSLGRAEVEEAIAERRKVHERDPEKLEGLVAELLNKTVERVADANGLSVEGAIDVAGRAEEEMKRTGGA